MISRKIWVIEKSSNFHTLFLKDFSIWKNYQIIYQQFSRETDHFSRIDKMCTQCFDNNGWKCFIIFCKKVFWGKIWNKYPYTIATGRISPNQITLAFDGLQKVELHLHFHIFSLFSGIFEFFFYFVYICDVIVYIYYNRCIFSSQIDKSFQKTPV